MQMWYICIYIYIYVRLYIFKWCIYSIIWNKLCKRVDEGIVKDRSIVQLKLYMIWCILNKTYIYIYMYIVWIHSWDAGCSVSISTWLKYSLHGYQGYVLMTGLDPCFHSWGFLRQFLGSLGTLLLNLCLLFSQPQSWYWYPLAKPLLGVSMTWGYICIWVLHCKRPFQHIYSPVEFQTNKANVIKIVSQPTWPPPC